MPEFQNCILGVFNYNFRVEQTQKTVYRTPDKVDNSGSPCFREGRAWAPTMSLNFRHPISFATLFLLTLFTCMTVYSAPQLSWLKPTAGQLGRVVEIEIHGSSLSGSHAVWFGADGCLYSVEPSTSTEPSTGTAPLNHVSTNPDGLKALISQILVKNDQHTDDRAVIKLSINPDARIGQHELRLVSPGGLSNSLSFAVVPDVVIDKSETTHNTPATAHPISVPAAVSGRFSGPHRLHYYSFDVASGQTIGFEVPVLQGADRLDGHLALYDTKGSWLDPGQSHRLVFNEEKAYGVQPAGRKLSYHFNGAGRYVVEVGSIFGQAGMAYSYLLQISPVNTDGANRDDLAWARDRMQTVFSRSPHEPPADNEENPEGQNSIPSTRSIMLTTNTEPDDRDDEAGMFSFPAVLAGSIEHPGDIDWFKFNVEYTTGGQTLAFEIDTPHIAEPFFHPCLEVLDSGGESILTNLEISETRITGMNTEMSGTFEQEGAYHLKVRDITSTHGDPGQVYRILVRRQVPHLRDVRVQEDRINLARGASETLTIDTESMESFDGDLAIFFESLPKGIHAHFSTTGATMVLVADNDAPLFPIPQILRLTGQVMDGRKPGKTFPVGALPIMVVN
jgi:hypothetical protein